MAKTKAELLNEYRDLKKENLKLTNQLEHWKGIARKENDRVVELATKLDEWKDVAAERNGRVGDLIKKLEECEKEKTLIRSQRDNLLVEYEKSIREITKIQGDLEILQSEVRKIQYDEEVTYHKAYEEGYSDAEHKFSQALDNREEEIEDLLDHCDIYWWILRSLHENTIK